MAHIVTIDQLPILTSQSPFITTRKVVVGGCFDLLHIGHIQFLQKAKENGELLIILLESDLSVAKKKGPHRPINQQSDRAFILSELRSVDYIVLLPDDMTDNDYLEVTKSLRPAIIATTSGDMHIQQKKHVAEQIQAEVIEVNTILSDTSTSHLATLLAKETL